MSLSYVVVSIQRASREVVAAALEQYLAPQPAVGALHCGRLRFELVDRSEEIEFAQKFLEEHKLADANPIWHELDSSEFRIDVEVHAPQDERTSVPKEVMGDALARFLSLSIGARTALSINNGYVPFGIYENGEKCNDYPDQYSHCFAGRPGFHHRLRKIPNHLGQIPHPLWLSPGDDAHVDSKIPQPPWKIPQPRWRPPGDDAHVI